MSFDFFFFFSYLYSLGEEVGSVLQSAWGGYFVIKQRRGGLRKNPLSGFAPG